MNLGIPFAINWRIEIRIGHGVICPHTALLRISKLNKRGLFVRYAITFCFVFNFGIFIGQYQALAATLPSKPVIIQGAQGKTTKFWPHSSTFQRRLSKPSLPPYNWCLPWFATSWVFVHQIQVGISHSSHSAHARRILMGIIPSRSQRFYSQLTVTRTAKPSVPNPPVRSAIRWWVEQDW